MDEHGVDLHVLSLTCPGVQIFDPKRGAELAVLANDRLADAISRHPERLTGLAAVAPQAPEAAAAEVDRAVTKLGLKGVIVNSHTHGEYLDDRKFWPIFEACEALEVPLYLHPRATSPQMYEAYRPYALEAAIWGYQVETSLHALRIVLGGVFDRFPKLRLVLGHMGEGIPFWFYRIDYMQRGGVAFGWRPRIERPPSEYFHTNVTITTSGMNWDPPLRFCLDVLGADNVMFAVDYPYQQTEDAVPWMDAAPLSEEDRDKVYRRNAERVFKLTPAPA